MNKIVALISLTSIEPASNHVSGAGGTAAKREWRVALRSCATASLNVSRESSRPGRRIKPSTCTTSCVTIPVQQSGWLSCALWDSPPPLSQLAAIPVPPVVHSTQLGLEQTIRQPLLVRGPEKARFERESRERAATASGADATVGKAAGQAHGPNGPRRIGPALASGAHPSARVITSRSLNPL